MSQNICRSKAHNSQFYILRNIYVENKQTFLVVLTTPNYYFPLPSCLSVLMECLCQLSVKSCIGRMASQSMSWLNVLLDVLLLLLFHIFHIQSVSSTCGCTLGRMTCSLA